MLLGGFSLLIGRPGAVVWAYLFNLGIALLFSLRLHAQLASLLDRSVAAERLNSGFDVPSAAAAMLRLGRQVPNAGVANYLGLPVWLLVYFVLVAGTLFCYRVRINARLGTLLDAGLCFFWRFVRVTLLAVLVSGVILAALVALQTALSARLEEHVVGVAVYWYELPGWVLILLVASLLRLYFDLVEAYTVQLDAQYRSNGKPDKRIRRALIPAAKTLRRNWARALGTFLLLAIAGALSLLLLGRMALHTLAAPRVWPAFLLVQAGLLINLATRFWQRGAETVLVAENPIAWVPELDPWHPIAPGCCGYEYEREPEFQSPYPARVTLVQEPPSGPLRDPEPHIPPVARDAELAHPPSPPPVNE